MALGWLHELRPISSGPNEVEPYFVAICNSGSGPFHCTTAGEVNRLLHELG